MVEHGFKIVAERIETSPAVVTVSLSDKVNSLEVGDFLEEAGFLVSYKSPYLAEKNWMQICLMGEASKEDILPLFEILKILEVNKYNSSGAYP